MSGFTREEIVNVARHFARRHGLDDALFTDEEVCAMTEFRLPPLRANGAQKSLQCTPHTTDTRHSVRVESSADGENPVLTASDKS